MLRVRQEHGVAALRGEVYVVGGYAMNPTTSVDVYNPTTRAWRAVASLPMALQHPNVAVVRDRLFIAGYFEGQGTGSPRDNAYVYDPDRDRWDAVSPLPAGTGRAAGCVAIIGDNVYLFGGRRGDMSVAYASVYDVAADSWQKLPDMPVRREHCGAGLIGGKIYIVGGRTDTIRGFEPTSLVFDPASPGYAQRKPILTPRGGLAAAVIGTRLYTFGGEGNAAAPEGVFAEVQAYDPGDRRLVVPAAPRAPPPRPGQRDHRRPRLPPRRRLPRGRRRHRLRQRLRRRVATCRQFVGRCGVARPLRRRQCQDPLTLRVSGPRWSKPWPPARARPPVPCPRRRPVTRRRSCGPSS